MARVVASYRPSVQIVSDLVQSGGIVGGPWVPLEKQTKPVEVVFCNPDLLWRSDFPTPRLGQGAFKEAFLAVYNVRSTQVWSRVSTQVLIQALTGRHYPHIQYGKPTEATYNFAKETLAVLLRERHGVSSAPDSL